MRFVVLKDAEQLDAQTPRRARERLAKERTSLMKSAAAHCFPSAALCTIR